MLSIFSCAFLTICFFFFFFKKYLCRAANFLIGTSKVALVIKNLPDNAWGVSNVGLIPDLGRFPGGGNGNPFQYSCLENCMDRWTWWATVQGATKSQAQLSNLGHSTYTHFFKLGCFLLWWLLSCMRCLYILEMNYLLVPSSANTFSHSVGCLLILFMVSFALGKEPTFYVGLFQRKICST